MNLIDKIKLRLCGDFLSIASLKMQVEDLELENEELKQKNKTLSNNNNSYSKTWEDMFYKDWAEEIYQSEMKQELMEENTELYSQLQELAKVHEEMKQNYHEKIRDKNLRIIELEIDNNTLAGLGKSFGKTVSNLLNENSNLTKEKQSKDFKIERLSYNNDFLEKRNKELENIQEDYNLLLYQYQRLQGVKEDFAETQKEYVDKVRTSYDLDAEEDITKVKLEYEHIISDLKKTLYPKSEVDRYRNKVISLEDSLKEKDEELAELYATIRRKENLIIQLKSEKENLLLKKDVPLVKRGDKQYNRFRKAVLKRDNYTCQCCGSTDASIVHHQFPFATYNHLGADTKNGIVLCKECHQKYHSKYGINGHTNNPVTFAQFLRDEGKVMQSTLEDNSCQPLTFDSLIHKPSSYKQVMDYINHEVE